MGWRAGERPRHGPVERSGEEPDSPTSSSSSSCCCRRSKKRLEWVVSGECRHLLILLRHCLPKPGLHSTYLGTTQQHGLGASEAPFRRLVATQRTLKLSGFPAGDGSCRFTQLSALVCYLYVPQMTCCGHWPVCYTVLWHCISCFRLPCGTSGLQLQHIIAKVVAGG